MTDVSEFFPDPSGLSRDVRDTLMHAARRHLKVSRVPLTRTQVADLFAEGFVGIPIESRHEDDWYFTNEGLKMAAACGFFGAKPERSQEGERPDKERSE